ncbi:MAG: rhodanese-like domain-containing protein [Pseudomonadota bacterium]|nr:rhodanese-like domain-containing protein [Pseudomonadota bacterium]
MFFQQFKVEGLGCLSYMIGCPQAGSAIVVDPKRDIDDYLRAAQINKMKITGIIETHVHADHISGAAELKYQTGAPIHIGAGSPVDYDHLPLHDGDEIVIGNAKIRVIATPGHTPNSISLALTDLVRGDLVEMLLTGDLLFVGSIGRPDLAGGELIEEQIRNAYHSLRVKLDEFPDYVEVYPAHGAGSLCGAGISAKPSSTLGFERLTNPFMQLDFEDFKIQLSQNTPHRPINFTHIINSNLKGQELIEKLPLISEYKPLTCKKFLETDPSNILIDLREATAFGGAHIPGSFNIGMAPNSATWIGNVVKPESEILLLANNHQEIETATTMFRRVGYDNIRGCIIGLSSWILAAEETGFLPQISVHSLHHVREKYDNHMVLDVRNEQEWQTGHIEKAEHLALPELINQGFNRNLDQHISVICMSGYRSNIAASILKQQGYKNVYSVIGGMSTWKAAGYKLEKS